jgi:phosphoglycerate dehydrogenase-like enzyme
MPKVLITTALLADLDKPFLQVLRGAGLEVIYPQQRKQLTEEELLVELAGVSATLAGSEPYTQRVLESHPQLRVIARNGVGYDAVDLAAATERGVVVTVAPGTNHESVAEHTMALLLTLTRSIIPQHEAIRAGGWRRNVAVPLRERTLGLVGLGRIGKAVAVRAAAFRMRLLAHEPAPDMHFVNNHQITLAPLPQLLAESDFVSLHVPLSKDTRHLIDGHALALMKPTALLINTARGDLVCEADLVRALHDHRLAAAGLDVFADEPLPPDHPLLRLDNVVCTAHTAGTDLQSRDDMALSAAHSIVALSRGQWPEEQIINRESRTKFRWP